MALDGIITKGIGGFYYVDTNDGLYECRARGKFRSHGISPAVGDKVKISVIDSNKLKGSLDEIYERKNCLLRPVVANVDKLIIVSAAASPDFDFFFTDKLCAVSELYDIEPVIVINKTDLSDGREFGRVYENIGYKVIYTNNVSDGGVAELKDVMKNGINVFGGFSGVGKSTLINSIFGDTARKTGEVSRITRGRHTTRHSELFKIDDNTYIADTPGFSAFEINFKIDNLPTLFREFADYSCKFSTCSHTKEKDCAIKEAVKNGEIAKSRYESYLMIYENIKDIPFWKH